jgi:CheY-like chemotaxis protein
VLFADERRIRQALINLLSNAIKFTRENGTIGLKVQGDSVAEVVYLTVWDTGIGIAPEDAPQLFKPFAQIEGAYQRGQKGSGLGLLLVAQITKLHGGSVQLSSAVDQGSQFVMALPWNMAEITAAMAEEDPSPPLLPAIDPAHRSDHIVLFIEDDVSTLPSHVAYLRQAGFRVIQATSGEEALMSVRSILPDAIVLDTALRNVGGLELIEQLRANVPTSTTPIMALSALTIPGDSERFTLAGANSYISKPIRPQQMVEKVLKYLQGRHDAGRMATNEY